MRWELITLNHSDPSLYKFFDFFDSQPLEDRSTCQRSSILECQTESNQQAKLLKENIVRSIILYWTPGFNSGTGIIIYIYIFGFDKPLHYLMSESAARVFPALPKRERSTKTRPEPAVKRQHANTSCLVETCRHVEQAVTQIRRQRTCCGHVSPFFCASFVLRCTQTQNTFSRNICVHRDKRPFCWLTC